MKMKITVEPQPREFIQRQAPDARRGLREALHTVETGKAFPVALQDELDGFYKLKFDGYRFILQHVASPDGPFFRVVFCERRAGVYQLFKLTLGLE
jgi:mRNA-degrading endonuclease RelE of RelBE toxin-antitoxin system